MSRSGTPLDNKPQAPSTTQFQFQSSVPYPMSLGPNNTTQQSTAQPTQTAPSTSQATTSTTSAAPPAPSSSMATTVPASSQSQASGSQAQNPAQSTAQARIVAEQARKDKTLAEFMLLLDDYEPLIPNEVTDYYLQKVGFETEDVRLKRLLALAAQKFVSDIAADAFQHARIRTNATAGGRGRAPLGQSSRDKTRTTLTMDDLSAALSEYGINARKPDFYM